MSYLNSLPLMLFGHEQLYRQAVEGKVRSLTVINMIILGIFYGMSNLYGALIQTPDLPMSGKFALITPLLFSIAGVCTMVAVLFGFCLVYWAAARAFGGPGGFSLISDLIGVSTIPFWFLAPLLNYAIKFDNNEQVSLIILIPLVFFFIWAFRLVRNSLVVGQGLSVGKATLALACMWIFSISAVYVFLP